MTTNVYNNGKVHVQARRCSTCIFRPGNLMDLEEGRVEDMVSSCLKNQGVIPCHQTLGSQESVCNGFFTQYKHEVQLLSIAERMGVVRMTDPS